MRYGDGIEFGSDLHSNEHYLSSSEINAWKKNSGLYEIWTHDFCDTGVVQYFTNWANKATGNWLLYWFVINLRSDE